MSRILKPAFHSRARLRNYVIYGLVPLIWMSVSVTKTGGRMKGGVSKIPRGFVAAYNSAVLPTRMPHNSLPVANDGPNTRIPWLIVGGGIHGVHIAARLIGEGKINSDAIRIIDTNESLLQTWKSRTAATGMEYLRSSAGFHLDVDERSLRQFGAGAGGSNSHQRNKPSKKKRKKKTANINIRTQKRNDAFSNDYERPKLAMFNEHCDSVVTKYHLDQCHVQGTVTSMEPSSNHVTVEVRTNDDLGGNTEPDGHPPHSCSCSYTAQNVILALGNDVPTYADWVTDEDIEQGYVHHLLDLDHKPTHSTNAHNREVSERNERTQDGDVAVIGGGITAAHKALELVRNAKQGPTTSTSTSPTQNRRIHLISRHPIKEQQFDTHQDWMMDLAACQRIKDMGGEGRPRRQERFAGCSCWKERRTTIAQERIAGTVTPAIYRGEQGLGWAIGRGDIDWHQAEVLTKRYVDTVDEHGRDRKRMELTLSCGNVITVDKVLLATGFGKQRPGGDLITNLVETFHLPVSEFDGFPIVDEHLSWDDHSRIYVAGALAELELGPSARNIAGARLAAERILQAPCCQQRS